MWKRFFSALPYILLYVTAVLVIGFVNLINVEGNYEFWNDPIWWNRTISQNIASILTLTGSIMMYLSKLRENFDDYLTLKKQVDSSVRGSLESDFGQFIFIENKATKTRAYIDKIERKIARQEKRARQKSLEIWFEGTEERKKKNLYCRRRARLEAKLRPERLDRRIMSIKIDYDKIDRNFIETGHTNRNVKQYQKLDSTWRKVIDNAPRFLFGIAAAAFFNAFLYDINQMDAAFWYRVAFSLGILVWMFINGKMYAESYMDKILIVDLNTRFNVIKNYLTWKLSKKKEVYNGN